MGPKKILSFAAIVLLATAVTFCKKERELVHTVSDSAERPAVPAEPIDFPASSNDHLATLGKVLFYDKELSSNKNISCGSCHKQENAFCDNLQFSPGTDNRLTERNTPSIFAKNGRLFWDGRAFSLEDLALRPVRNTTEMNSNVSTLIGRIASLDYYNELFNRAFPNSGRIDSHMVKTAIAEFLRNFNFSDNKFHRSTKGQDNLNASENVGRDLFFGRAQCSNCHHIEPSSFNGYGSTDESHNIGLDAYNHDAGVGAVTRNQHEEGAFMMPVLLNVELTAPYMHDGRFKTLEEVVEHYDSDVKDNPNLDPRLRTYSNGEPLKLNLTDVEKKGLVDFLKSLTDPSIKTDDRFSDPFVARAR